MNVLHCPAMGKSLYPPGALFCRTCGYCLHGLPEPRCPECGHDFDPANPKTFRTRPRRTWPKRLLLWGGTPLLLLIIAYGALLGWLYLGWASEAPARALVPPPGQLVVVSSCGSNDSIVTAPILPASVGWLIPPACRPWTERVQEVVLIRQQPQDLAASLARCRQLKKLSIFNIPLHGPDIQGIARLGTLRSLELCDNGLTSADLAPLAGLSNLEQLYLRQFPPLDDGVMATIARLPGLHRLVLDKADITDARLTALAGLPNLRELGLYSCLELTGTAVDKLARLKRLQRIELWGTNLSPEAISRLKAALPQRTIDAR